MFREVREVPGMAEKKGGESSDSEAYLSADEGLSSSRGSTKDVVPTRSVRYSCE